MSSINNTTNVTSIKLSYNNELRRFPFPVDNSDGDADQYLALTRTIAKSFGVPRSAIALQYVDEENDTITVSSQLELSAAVASTSSPVLRLSLVVLSGETGADAPTPAGAPACPGGAKWRKERGERGCGGGHKRLARFALLREQFRPQLAELEREGLIDSSAINANGFGGGVFWAVHLLTKLNGDLGATKSHILSRKDKMRELKSKYAAQLSELQRAGFLPASDAPVDHQRDPKGRCMARKAIGLLERFDGDVHQVMAHLEKKRAKHLSRHQQQPEQPRSQFEAELAELKARGFKCEGVCLRLLHKFDGDVEKVAARMETFRQARLEKHQHHQQTVPTTDSEHSAQIDALMAKGLPRHKCERLLRKFDGDLARVEQALENRRKWMTDASDASGSGKCHGKRHGCGLKEAKQQYASEIAQLKDMGFRRKWAIVPLLKQHNGDVQAVALALSSSA